LTEIDYWRSFPRIVARNGRMAKATEAVLQAEPGFGALLNQVPDGNI